ncbi:MAG: ATP-binding protein [Bacteroidota bacterium]|nr:ATP-binding protein [Bacteroidota bacterium]
MSWLWRPRRGRPGADPVRPPRFGERVDDRGKAKYFHGRDEELETIESLCYTAMHNGGGAIVVIQGPPGAGKTALLHECARHAQAWGWRVVRIRHDAFWDRESLHNAFRRPRWHTHVDEGGMTVLGGWGFFGRARKLSAPDLLRYQVMKSRKCVLLWLDEAQSLVGGELSGAERTSAVKMLDDIHNGGLGKPVVLIAGGLAHTAEGLERFEISKLRIDDIIELSGLDAESEKSIIRDWLEKESGAIGDVAHWVDTIAQDTDGWPQHISAYVQRASWQLVEDKGTLTDAGLAKVLEKGRADKTRFYNRRLRGIGKHERQLLGLVIACCGLNARWTRIQIEATFPALKDSLQYPADDSVSKLIRRGVLEASDEGEYRIPIPSMERFLVGYAWDLEQTNGGWVQELTASIMAALSRTNHYLTPERKALVLSGNIRELLTQLAAGPSVGG